VQTIALIDYGSGNIASAARALAVSGDGRVDVRVTAAPDVVAKADRIVLPGQGAFAQCMAGLSAVPGLVEAMREAVLGRGAPFLGICVGMQLLAATGLEHGEHAGLGWIGGVCRPLIAPSPAFRIPHMGWNEAAPSRPHPVFDALAPAQHVYFAHSYIVAPDTEDVVAARTSHGELFAAALAKDNMIGVQFHPEKSQAAGLALLRRFLAWAP
jgi:imidazole glycerol-phosphate synthase subunit HisH